MTYFDNNKNASLAMNEINKFRFYIIIFYSAREWKEQKNLLKDIN